MLNKVLVLTIINLKYILYILLKTKALNLSLILKLNILVLINIINNIINSKILNLLIILIKYL